MDKLSSIPGLGPKTEIKLNELGIFTPTDLLYHFPSRYLDFSHTVKISSLSPDQSVTVTGKVQKFQNIFTRSGKNLQKATISDSSGSLDLIWFNQPYLSKTISIGSVLSFAGTIQKYQSHLTLIAPVFGRYNTGQIIAIYPQTQGLTSNWFRKAIQTNLSSLIQNTTDSLPSDILRQHKLISLSLALTQIHCPQNQTLLTAARLRLALDEIISLQAQSYLQKKTWTSLHPHTSFISTPVIEKKLKNFIKSLPFNLTPSQVKAWGEIKADFLSSQKPMNRLLQGDVGSGKTIPAMLSCLLASYNRSLSLLLVPTGILAHQHFATFKKFLPKLPLHLLTSSEKIKGKIAKNSIIIATHAALFQSPALKAKIALLIVDEQHKFGVKQRAFLGNTLAPPHCLTMTATPIPRTIGLTFLGHLDLSTIDHPPKDRLSIKTFLVPNPKAQNCYQWLQKHIQSSGEQAFVVCPFIELSETLQTVKSAQVEFDNLSKNIFPQLRLALIHGRLKPAVRHQIIADFKDKKIDILVTTPIIEVGIDIPNSTTIIIQSADRFGLAQLHQLRGRVGRGSLQSYCYLFSESDNDKSQSRLKFLETNHDGLKIAEFDLKTRGPGEAFSTIQHGFPSLRLASLSNLKLISFSQKILQAILDRYPDFNLQSLVASSSPPILHQAN